MTAQSDLPASYLANSLASWLNCDNPQISGFAPARKCGKCHRCVAYKRWVWSRRCDLQIARHPRSVMLRLSFRFATSEPKAYSEFQKFMKRLRAKQKTTQFSYLCVVEYGTKGTKRLHLHALVSCPKEVTIRSIRKHWKAGQTHGKLADSGSSAYVTKYLFKDQLMNHRVRCSQGYGKPPERIIDNETVHEILAHFPKATVKRVATPDGSAIPRKLIKPQWTSAISKAQKTNSAVTIAAHRRCQQIVSRFAIDTGLKGTVSFP